MIRAKLFPAALLALLEAIACAPRRAHPLLGFWGALLRSSNGGDDQDDYLLRLRALPGGVAAESAVRALLEGAPENVVTGLLAADPGLAPATLDELPAGYHEFSGLVAATLLLRHAAGHDVAPSWELGAWRAQAAPDLGLAELAGHDARLRGADAHDGVASACRRKGAVEAEVRSRRGTLSRITLSCPDPFPLRPPYVQSLAPGAEYLGPVPR